MKVYALTRHYESDTAELLGVFSSDELAKKYAQDRAERKTGATLGWERGLIKHLETTKENEDVDGWYEIATCDLDKSPWDKRKKKEKE